MQLNSRSLIRLFLASCFVLSGCAKDNTPLPTPLSKQAPTVLNVQSLWSVSATSGVGKKGLRLGGTLQGNVLVTAGYEGDVVAIDAGTGKVLWRQNLSEDISATPGVNDHEVFIGTTKGNLYALSLANGKVLWQTAMPSLILGAPAALSDIVVVHAHDASIEAYAADTGNLLWSYQGTSPSLSLYGNSSPVINAGTVFIGFESGQLGAFDLYHGTETWQVPVAIPSSVNAVDNLVGLDGTPTLDKGAVIATSYHGNLAAVNSTTGQVYWAKALSSFEAPCVADNKIFTTDATGIVMAVDEMSGQVLWQQKDLRYRFVSAPVAVNRSVIVGDYAGYVHFLAINTGHKQARIKISSAGINTPALLYNGRILLVTQDGKVVALEIKA